MSRAQIKVLIVDGVNNGKIIKQMGERILIKYNPKKFGISEMKIWVNVVTKEIETAFPIKGTSVRKR